MTFFEALFGSQYQEIKSKNGDIHKARFNGNLFLSAFVMILVFTIIILLVTIFPELNKEFTKILKSIFGYSIGKTIGKLIALPVLALIYLAVNLTLGNKNKFEIYIANFLLYSEEEKSKANKIILKPFFILLGIFFIVSMLTLLKR